MSDLQTRIVGYADKAALDAWWQFIHERHMIWYRRFILEQPAPWTDNPILRDYKFTNVYRELDRGTIFLLQTIKNRKEPIDQVWNTVVYRMFNRVSTFEELGFKSFAWWSDPKNFRKAFDRLRAYQDAGNAIYTDAHMVCAYEHFPGKDKLERFEYIFTGVLQGMDALMRIIAKAKSLETVHKALTKFPGIGPFLAYEMAVDISYYDWNNLGEDEWVNPGPGCQRGLRYIFPKIKTKDMTFRIHELREIQMLEFQRLKLPFMDIAYQGKTLTLRNIEHCLCEGFKNFKAMDGSGRPRNKFNARAEHGAVDFMFLKG